MCFESISDLPDHIKRTLPESWQELYRNTYNTAFEEYANDILAHKVAWSEIEYAFPKDYRRKKYEM